MAVITILGAGVMGSAMCLPASDNGHDVRLVGTHLDEAIIDSIRQSGRHPKLSVTLPKATKAFQHAEFEHALGADTDLIVLGVSSAGVDWAIDRLCATLNRPVPVVMITKGMNPLAETLQSLPDYVSDEVRKRNGLELEVAAIGGPCIAGELAVRRQTGTVVTAPDLSLAQSLCAMFACSYYHPRVSSDLIGVEACAAYKNFYAIAVGWATGRRDAEAQTQNGAFNHNAAAIIFAQAIKELAALALALGGKAESAYGMPGAGDLYVTCQAGRNSRLGQNLGRGLTYREIVEGPMKGDTIEGAELGRATASALAAMMRSGKIKSASMPLARALFETLVNDCPLDLDWRQFHEA